MVTVDPDYWRMWTVTPGGALLGPFSSLGKDPRYAVPWPADGPMTAWCDAHPEPPAGGCECGLRGLPDARDALTSAAMAGWLDLETWAVPWLLRSRIVLAIGQVELSGRITGPSPSDPPCCARGQYARPAGTLYVTGNGRDRVEAMEDRYRLPVLPLGALVMELAARA